MLDDRGLENTRGRVVLFLQDISVAWVQMDRENMNMNSFKVGDLLTRSNGVTMLQNIVKVMDREISAGRKGVKKGDY